MCACVNECERREMVEKKGKGKERLQSPQKVNPAGAFFRMWRDKMRVKKNVVKKM